MKKSAAVLFSGLVFAQVAFAKVDTITLSNGIKVVFDKTNGVKVASIKVWTPVSVIVENQNNAGISSLTNELMEKSTLNRSVDVLSDAVEDIGASLSSETDYDYAFIDMSFLAEYFEKAVDVLSDIVINPAFNEKEISAEKLNIIAGLNSRKDNIQDSAEDVFNEGFYKNTPYALPEEGQISAINKLTREDLINWHKYAYNASNILISVSGNLDKDKVKKTLEKYFSKIEKGQKFKKPDFNIIFPKENLKKVKSKFNQAYIFMGYPAPSLSDKDFVILKVISDILGGKMTSRLFIQLREEMGLAYAVGSVYPARLEQSYFAVYIGLDKKNVNLTLKRIDEILSDFRSAQINQQELKDSKNHLRGSYLMSRQTVYSKSLIYGLREVLGQGYEYDAQYLNYIDSVSVEDIYRVANKIFSQEPYTVVLE